MYDFYIIHLIVFITLVTSGPAVKPEDYSFCAHLSFYCQLIIIYGIVCKTFL